MPKIVDNIFEKSFSDRIFDGSMFRDGGRSLKILAIGDSLVNAMATTYAQNYIDNLSTYGIDAQIFDAAQGGLRLSSYYTNGDIAEYYTARVLNDNADNLDSIDTILFGLGTNDDGVYGSKSAWKSDYQALIARVKTDMPNLEKIFIRTLARHTTNNGLDVAWNDMNEAIIEIANEDDMVVLLPPNHDLPIVDNVHFTNAGYILNAHRESSRIAFLYGFNSIPSLGMRINTASIQYDGILLDVTLDQGNDIDVGTDNAFFNGVLFDTIERVSATQIKLKSGAPYTGTPTIRTGYGAMFDLGKTPDMTQENGSLTLPFQKQSIVTANNLNDPILDIQDLRYYFRPTFEKTTTTGTQFNSIKSVDGSHFDLLDSNEFDFDATAFGGSGGIVPLSASSSLVAQGDLLEGVPQLTGIVIDVVEDNVDLLQFGNIENAPIGAQATAVMYVENGALKYFRSDSSPIVQTITTGVVGSKISIIINTQSLSVMDIYVDDAITPANTSDPQNFVGWRSMYINGGRGFGSTQNKFGLVFAKEGSHDAVNDPLLATLMTELNNFKNGL